ncbi:protein MpNPH3 [Marchantia polymorpha subsp. ruderalis]|uniref:NPH3 domain-containing protein n=2 Tax=Marchantia polymorpha TaxID=3197 RepID=A0AAF6BJA3_MARPO|nr:hypothetical protein MARPO_0182s0022 [Marchantia polymorpha]BAV53283.1 non-phototropic hypocotyl 3-like protein [Marchantia polymorpha]BBN12087.1 hypothetical protein Mp_5g17270 [Marchantia polymorpha subsp. ruderalis]|eukprot:PTQ27846.1 hypothetical protein MARPO_0182s0022 [Marchantia polymorpha]
MRIDHGPVQAMQVHHPPTPGDVPGAGKNVHAKDNYRLLQAESDDSSQNNREMCPLRLGTKVDGFERKGQQWFVATELQSDLVVEVGDMSFHLHKFPLLSRSGKLNRLVFDSRDVENSHIKLDDMPGGPETFELAAKFCYGVAVELTSANVASLRCAAEYLEMGEDLEEGNLMSKTEAFLSFVVLASWKDSIAVLQSCEKLTPWAEQLQIVRRCCESIAWKACTDPRGIRWSFTERAEATKKSHASPIWTGPKGGSANSISDQVPSDWWFEDICVVCVTFFTKIIAAIKVKGMRYDLIGSAIVHYALKWLPGLTRDFVVMPKDPKEPTLVDGSFLAFGGAHGGKDKDDEAKSSDLGSVQDKQRVLVETLVGILPSQKDAVPCTFLLRLLRLAKMLSINPGLITELEKRAGQLLDQGTLSDLLIPSFDHTCETLFDVDLVQRLLDYFLLQDFASPQGTQSPAHDKDKIGTPSSDKLQPQSSYAAKMRVAKLIDNYLAEVGRDQNLTLHKFLALAEALPEHTRVTDDGLYKALDTYLKAHPLLTEHERKKLCRTLDCQRLSLDACMHAAQNERLPLRVVVQVLFGEQIKLRNAVTGSSSMAKEIGPPYPPADDDTHSPGGSSHESLPHDRGSAHHSDHHEPLNLNPEESEEEIRVLRSDVEKMKGKFMALQHDYSAIQQQLEKLTKHPKPPPATGWKKLLPHPHFHAPHFLSHPLDIFHHKDHHHGHGHGHGKDSHHGHHHHGKDSQHGHGHSKGGADAHGHHHSKKHEAHDHAHLIDNHRHSAKGDSKHPKEHDSHHHHHHHHHHSAKETPRHSKDHEHRHSKDRDTHSKEHDLPPYVTEGFHSAIGPEAFKETIAHARVHHSAKGPEAFKESMAAVHAHVNQHSKNHELHRTSRDSHHSAHSTHSTHSTHSKDSSHHHARGSHEQKDYQLNLQEHPAAAQLPQKGAHEEHRPSKDSTQHHSDHHKDGEAARLSNSHLSSGEDSSRSMEGPTTPTHPVEHKKHRPFANAIRKWRNSIS